MNVTIIVPFYNREKYLRDTLNSIKNQHFKHWRAILIDDMSEDSSLLIAKEFGEQDSRFIIIENTIKQRREKQKIKE